MPLLLRSHKQGLWVGMTFDPETGMMKAVSPPYAHGSTLAY